MISALRAATALASWRLTRLVGGMDARASSALLNSVLSWSIKGPTVASEASPLLPSAAERLFHLNPRQTIVKVELTDLSEDGLNVSLQGRQG